MRPCLAADERTITDFASWLAKRQRAPARRDWGAEVNRGELAAPRAPRGRDAGLPTRSLTPPRLSPVTRSSAATTPRRPDDAREARQQPDPDGACHNALAATAAEGERLAHLRAACEAVERNEEPRHSIEKDGGC